MVSRRRFLQLGSVAATATLAGSASGESADSKCPSVPPSIASLKSRKDEARPITTAERTERQQRARQLMQQNGIGAIVLTEGSSLTYFTGVKWWGSERLFAMILPAKGRAFYVCPAFEEGRAREQLALAPDGQAVDLRTWQEDESPYERVAQGLRDRGIATGTLAMEEAVRYVFSSGIAQSSPQAKIINATLVTAGCRMIKTPHEIDLMRLAAKVTLTAYKAA